MSETTAPMHKGGIQFTALKQAAKMDIVRDADWIMALDIDEFVNIHTGDHSLPALLAALPDATAITLTWRLFGNRPILSVHRQCRSRRPCPLRTGGDVLALAFGHVQDAYRNDGTYRKLGVHRPRNPVPERLSAARWFDGEGRELDDRFKHKRQFSDYGRPNHGLVQLNHYPLGAMASYLLKADRGRAVHSHQILDVDYWVERNFNTDSDRSILRTQSQSDPLLHTLHSDSDLATLHAQAVSWRQDRFQFLMEQEPFRALFARLLMTAPSRPITANAAIQLTRYALKGLHSGTDGAT